MAHRECDNFLYNYLERKPSVKACEECPLGNG